MLQAWMAGATVFSGGQGYVNFNTLLAPFCKGRSYEDIKQAIQGFIFNCNMSLICRGGQVLFSSIALDLSVPDVLKDEPAISFGGVSIGTYKDYQEEADLVFRAVCEVSNEKDGEGAYHRFPNILFNIRKGDLDEYKGTCKILHETGANNPTIYYNNCLELERSTMGCRSSLPMNYTGDYNKDCVNTGNFMYNTINLPLLALESGKDLNRFFKKLDEVCEICYKSLIHRRNVVIDMVYNKHISDFLLQEDKDTGEPLWDIDRTTITLGYCGLNECLLELFDEDITDKDTETNMHVIIGKTKSASCASCRRLFCLIRTSTVFPMRQKKAA
jgi:ribonucleoside-triphosphate reductase